MTISNYPNGFAQGVSIRNIPLLSAYGGDLYWVDSGAGSDFGKGTHNQPFKSLDYAIGRCSANNGDIIIAKAGHAETVATAAGINQDVAGTAIIGLGSGADRPTLTFSAVDATMTITAASSLFKNFLIKPSIDAVVSPIVVSAADCTIDVEVQDASATVECATAILTTNAADRLDINLKYRGFLAGNACVAPIRLVGVDTARIYVDFYGVASTSIVEFHTTACHDIVVTGKFYNNGTTLTKNVLDTVSGSTWSATGWDGNSNASFSGGDNAALAADDVGAVSAAVATVDGIVDAILVDTDTTIPGLIATAQTDLDILTGADGAILLSGTQASIDDILADTAATQPSAPMCASKTLTTIVSGNNDLFVISGPVKIVEIIGIVTTEIEAKGCLINYNMDPTIGADVAFGTDGTALEINADAAGTLYTWTGVIAADLIATTAGTALGMPTESGIILPAGSLELAADVATSATGAIAFHVRYVPLTPGATVVAA